MNRMLRVVPLLAIAFALSACGFHLRRNAPLPASMSRVHVNGDGDLQRKLSRALQSANVVVENSGGPGIAELHIPVNRFNTESLTQGGYVQITEYAVRMHTEFDLVGGDGTVLVPHQSVDMQDEYSFDSSETIGNASEIQQIQGSLIDDTVQAIMFRLEAAARHPQSTNQPASATGKP